MKVRIILAPGFSYAGGSLVLGFPSFGDLPLCNALLVEKVCAVDRARCDHSDGRDQQQQRCRESRHRFMGAISKVHGSPTTPVSSIGFLSFRTRKEPSARSAASPGVPSGQHQGVHFKSRKSHLICQHGPCSADRLVCWRYPSLDCCLFGLQALEQ